MKKVKQVKGPLISHFTGIIRNKETEKNEFAAAIENIVYLMSNEITGDVKIKPIKVLTPIAEADVAYFFDKILLIPVLRAGMAMFEPMRRILPLSTSGYIGIKRVDDGENFAADMYYCNLPPNLPEFKVFILDVVVATGSSIDFVVKHLISQGVSPENINLISIISSKKGLENLSEEFPDINIYTCEIDEVLNEKGYIVPGLGDAGNRYNGYDS